MDALLYGTSVFIHIKCKCLDIIDKINQKKNKLMTKKEKARGKEKNFVVIFKKRPQLPIFYWCAGV